ncbi:MAG: peptidylprolyl isomerase [Candidatus Omnitrophota bacterium]
MKIEIILKQLKVWWLKKQRLLLIVVAALTVFAIAGVAVKTIMEKRSQDLTLAVVDGHRIRVSDFRKQMAAVPEFYQAYVTGNRSQFLQDLIDRELVYQQARRSGYARNRDIEKRLEELRKDFVVQEYVQKEILENPDIPEKDMRQYYQSHPMDFIQPASIHLYEIMVSDLKTAENIGDRHRKGESFEDLARKYSEAPSKSRGGDLGFVREGKLSERLARVAFSLSPGQVSPPISTEAGYYILMAGQNIPSRQLSYEESTPLLKKIMYSKYGEKNFKDFLVSLRAKSKIKTMEANLEKMEF